MKLDRFGYKLTIFFVIAKNDREENFPILLHSCAILLVILPIEYSRENIFQRIENLETLQILYSQILLFYNFIKFSYIL